MWILSGVQMHYIAYMIAHKIARTFSLAFEKGKTGKVQNYIGTKVKILLKLIVESVLFKWFLCLFTSNFYQLP